MSQISPYTAAMTQIRPKLKDYLQLWDDIVQLYLCSFPQTQVLKIVHHGKNAA